MIIAETRFLRGPNLYAATPCLLALVDAGKADDPTALPDEVPGLGARLAALLPDTPPDASTRLPDARGPLDALAPLAMALQRAAGVPGPFHRTLVDPAHPKRARVVLGHEVEQVAEAALRAALGLIAALARDAQADVDIGAVLARLRDAARRHAVAPGTAMLLRAARARGIPVRRLGDDGDLFQLGWGSRQRRLHGTTTGTVKQIAVDIAADPALTRTVLAQAGCPVPAFETVATPEAALAAAKRMLDDGGQVALRWQNAGHDGTAAAACATLEDVRAAHDAAMSAAPASGHGIVVERRPPGRDYRILVAGDDVVAAAPGAGADLCAGGTAEDVTDLVAPDTRALCVRAARAIGLDVAGIDVVCADIARPLHAQDGAIVGVDAAPGPDTPRDAGAAIVATLFERGEGRIPLVAVAGTNGKTTTALLIAQAARQAGRRTGLATTEGVFVDGERLRRGDATGAHAARTVLAAPDVDFAVLETGRAGILRDGLAYDACDVAVVLNVAADKLGLDGVDSLDDLARVKGVVAASARRAVVLNADDERCAALAADVDAPVEVIYFAMDAENPVLVRHMERGGRAAYLQDEAVVLARRARHDALLDVRAMPATLKGAARYNIANGLAAAAALCAAGLSNDDIAAGLRAFVSDLKHNPLRSNVFDVDGVTVIVDAAHNAAAYAALAEAAREMTPGRIAGVVAAPGACRDADLVEIGVTCAAGFDELVIYEASPGPQSVDNARVPGDVARLLCEGARAGKFDPVHLLVEPDVHRAVRAGLARCLPGDVLVLGCAASINDLLDAIRPTSPATARRIATRMA